jgi:hypothetical protein
LPHTAQLGVGQFFRKEDWPTIFLMKKQVKTRVPQAQNWKPKTTQSRAANKKKKIITAQVIAQTGGPTPPFSQVAYGRSFFMPNPKSSSPPLTYQNLVDAMKRIKYASMYGMSFNSRHFDTLIMDDLVDKDNEKEEEFSPLLLLKAIISSNKEIRINRKCFQEAMDFEIEIETEHDEDFVVIRRK